MDRRIECTVSPTYHLFRLRKNHLDITATSVPTHTQAQRLPCLHFLMQEIIQVPISLSFKSLHSLRPRPHLKDDFQRHHHHITESSSHTGEQGSCKLFLDIELESKSVPIICKTGKNSQGCSSYKQIINNIFCAIINIITNHI